MMDVGRIPNSGIIKQDNFHITVMRFKIVSKHDLKKKSKHQILKQVNINFSFRK